MDSDEVRRNLGLPVISSVGRAKITKDLLMIMYRLHQCDFVLGNISPNNIYIYIDPDKQSKIEFYSSILNHSTKGTIFILLINLIILTGILQRHGVQG